MMSFFKKDIGNSKQTSPKAKTGPRKENVHHFLNIYNCGVGFTEVKVAL